MSEPVAPLRVVLADDTPDVRLLLRVSLGRSDGVEIVGEAADGAEAIRVVAAEQPDVIVLDLAMPVMDGLQAIPEIVRVSPHTKIIVMSGFDRSGIEDEATVRGAHAYVPKGKPLEELLSTIRAVCGRDTVRLQARPKPAREGTMEEVLSVLAHELSSPVAVVIGFASMLAEHHDRLSTSEVLDYIEAIQRGGKQLEDLINAFYDARYLESDDLPLNRRSTNVGELVRETVHDMTSLVKPHPLVLTDELDITAEIDPVRIRQVLEALIGNAAKFSPPTSSIDVGVARIGGNIEVTVRDHCPGIPEELRVRLFSKFGRLRKGVPGLGLGLYVGRGVARAHGGDVLYGAPPDGGCRFVLQLPV